MKLHGKEEVCVATGCLCFLHSQHLLLQSADMLPCRHSRPSQQVVVRAYHTIIVAVVRYGMQASAAQFDAFKSNVAFIHTYNAAHPTHQVGPC
jgi:hypothetical protein